MISTKALWLREQWRGKGNPPCEHERLELERTATGYYTGLYICVACGAELDLRMDPT